MVDPILSRLKFQHREILIIIPDHATPCSMNSLFTAYSMNSLLTYPTSGSGGPGGGSGGPGGVGE